MKTWRNRGVAVFALLALLEGAGCGPNNEGLQIRAGIKATVEKEKPANIRAAASALFAKRLGPDQTIPTKDIPAAVVSLPIFLGSSREDINAFACEHGELMFMTGSGFGHWGILICPSNSDVMPKQFDTSRLSSWGDGVFFFSEIKWK